MTAEETAVAPAAEHSPAPTSNYPPDVGTGYVTNIARATAENEDFREVLATAENLQLALMTLAPGEEIGVETHPANDQFIRVELGTGRVMLQGEPHELQPGSGVIIPAGVEHNLINTGAGPLKLYTIYSPPEHAPKTVHRSKEEAQAAEHGG